MRPQKRQQHQQTATRMTVCCLISLIIGSYIVWANTVQGINDSTTRLLPVVVMAVVHLLGGSLALYHARKTHQVLKNIHVYVYFSATLGLAMYWLPALF